jgi:hypothetical protein
MRYLKALVPKVNQEEFEKKIIFARQGRVFVE